MGEYNPIGLGDRMYLDSMFREEVKTTGRWVQIRDCQPKMRLRDRLKSERQVIASIRKGIKTWT